MKGREGRESVNEQLNSLPTSWFCFSLVCCKCWMMDWHSSRVGGRDPSITAGGAPSTRDNLAPDRLAPDKSAPDRLALVRENNYINFNLLAASNGSHLFCCCIIFCSTTLMRRVFLLFSSARVFLRSCTSSSSRNARSSSNGRIRMSVHTHTHIPV